MSANPDKKRFYCEDALPVARELCRLLKPVTTRLIVAGSLRRRKEEVGDVEILFIPRFEERPLDMFATAQFNLAEEALSALLLDGTLERRPNKNGGYTWGANNKLAVHRASGIPVDLFTATEQNWWNYLVCRTGPGESNIRIATEAQKRGWKWNPYGPGFSRGGDDSGEEFERRDMGSEREVFEFVGLEYKEPWERA